MKLLTTLNGSQNILHLILTFSKTFFFLLILGRNVLSMQTIFVRFIHQIHTICSVSLVVIFKICSKTLTPIKAFWAVLPKKATNWDSEQLVCIIVHKCVVFGAKHIFPVSCYAALKRSYSSQRPAVVTSALVSCNLAALTWNVKSIWCWSQLFSLHNKRIPREIPWIYSPSPHLSLLLECDGPSSLNPSLSCHLHTTP